LATLGRNLANEVGSRGITINTVEPGTIRTDRTARLFAQPQVAEMMAAGQAIERIGEPADIAAVVAFLASEDGGWVTVNVIDASGGTYLGPRTSGPDPPDSRSRSAGTRATPARPRPAIMPGRAGRFEVSRPPRLARGPFQIRGSERHCGWPAAFFGRASMSPAAMT
jgi:hypothetical protein